MKKISLLLIVFFIVAISFAQDAFHDLNVDIDVKDGSLKVFDIIHFKQDKLSSTEYFYLNKNLQLTCLDEDISVVKVELETGESDKEDMGEANKYKVDFGSSGKTVLPLSYEGVIRDEIATGAVEYARGFSETKGIISEEGVYLAASTYWVPYFPDMELLTFKLEVMIDSSWSVVSQGWRSENDLVKGKKYVIYESPEPMDEVYLIAAPWTEYQAKAGKVLLQAFLRTPDRELAERYLGVTSDYLKLYEDLIGPYPYRKFALVENFWETGYGMPSFTLLGPKVIRFPWILHSSYPHELLHNYWGNSVYVDYDGGNWCEGITAYMADHLIKEQSGQGDEYRRNTLQKFTDFVNSDNDFPLTEFRSRNNPAEEAIGYGKCLMMNEMLRSDLGDEVFLNAYSKFYSENKFKEASFDDIRKSFEEVSKKDLKPFFDQWVKRKGAPEINLSDVNVKQDNNKYNLSFVLSQVQEEDPFMLNVPVAVFLKGSDEVFTEKVKLDAGKNTFNLSFDSEPLKIEVDPQFNVFRRLDKNEVPATLSQLFGAKDAIVILPGNSDEIQSYQKLAEDWQKIQQVQGKTLEIVKDDEIATLPSDKTIWVFGFENKFRDDIEIPENYFNSIDDNDRVMMSDLQNEGSLVYVLPNPGNENYSAGFLGCTLEDAFAGLSRKLPHYGKYSYLGFEGSEPTNVLKGVFPVIDSPLSKKISNQEITAKLKIRGSLADH